MRDYESPHDRIYPEIPKAIGGLYIDNDMGNLRGKTVTIVNDDFPSYVYYAQFTGLHSSYHPNFCRSGFQHILLGNYTVTVEGQEGEKHISVNTVATTMEWQ